jgi:hypothetical protein
MAHVPELVSRLTFEIHPHSTQILKSGILPSSRLPNVNKFSRESRCLILQGEVESIAQMGPKGTSEYDDGLLEYLEDISELLRSKRQ